MTAIDPTQRQATRYLAAATGDLGQYIGLGHGLLRDIELLPVGDARRAQALVLYRHLLSEAVSRLAELTSALPVEDDGPLGMPPVRDMRDVRYPEGWPSDGPRLR